MQKINILPSEIFNRIAAGEVIENPSSVVKELVENSIDAGATTVSIEINNGGKYIKITDNGSGISPGDLPAAFLPHATSKISSIEDLDGIKTLGFRGEALPSIASVAKITVISRQTDSPLGSKIVLENGKLIEHTEAGSALGTTVIVEDLFKNVPARLKFLKSDRSEEGEITDLACKFILANFNVSISVSINGKQVTKSSGAGLDEAVFAVYGDKFIKETEYIESIMPDITVYGYINKPAYSKHNRSCQTLVVNGRYVISQDISFWIYNCYASVLMKRQYPAFILYINLPYDMVDINVHPNKLEVKFVDYERIRKLLSRLINNALASSSAQPKEIEVAATIDCEIAATKSGDRAVEEKPNNGPGTVAPGFTKFNIFESINVLNEPQEPVPDILYRKAEGDTFRSATVAPSNFECKKERVDSSDDYEDFSGYKYIGSMFNTYITLERGEEIILIDQHAAHERLLYEKLTAAIDCGENVSQSLLIPYIFELSVKEAALLERALPQLEQSGFVISGLSGNSYSMSGLPLALSDMRLEEFISRLIEALGSGKAAKSELLKDMIAQAACKAAVKGDTSLSGEDIKILLREITQKKLQLFCPHGRPIAVKINKAEIEKWFKRIV